MKKAMNIMILAALLTGCAANAKEEKNVIRSATTTTATTTTTAAVTTAVTTTKTVQTSTSVTTTAETTTTSVSAVSAASKTTTGKRTATQTPQTCIVYETEYAEVVQQDPDTQQEPAITTAATTTTAPPVTASAAVPTAHPTVEWSENMAIWRKLCEGKQLIEYEQNVIRSEIQDYAISTFNGKNNIHVSFGTDEYDISFVRPLELEVNSEMVTMDNAHMDAYCDPNCVDLINCAADEQEIYQIVSDKRKSCLHLIDHGLFNRWEMFSINNALKYASHVEFNIGFDEDMTLWFLTQD